MRRTIWVEPRTRPDTYSVRYIDPITGEKKREKADGKEALRTAVRRIEDRLESFIPGQGDPKAIPLVVMEDYLTDCLTREKKPIRRTTAAMKRENLTPFMETMYTMDQLTTDKIKTYSMALRVRGLAVDTIAIRLRDIRAFCNWAHKKGILAPNPWNDIGIPVSSFIGRRLTLEELQGLFRAMCPRLRDFIGLKFETGARKGELLQLEFSDVDFSKALWHLRGIEGKSKSKRDRVIPLSPDSIKMIERQKLLNKHFVFQGYTKNMLQRDLKTALALAKIQGRVREHDIRHTWASMFKGRRASLKALAGWTTDLMLNRYQHVEAEELREDMEKGSINLGRLLGRNEEKGV